MPRSIAINNYCLQPMTHQELQNDDILILIFPLMLFKKLEKKIETHT